MDNIRAIAVMHRREMNRTEAQYARHLEDRRITGEIRWWSFEAWKFRLADQTYYTPDFIVVDNALRIEAHEVKAVWSTGKPGWQEDARVKIKVAAEQHPVRFVAVSRGRDGNWEFEEFLKGREVPQEQSLFVKLVEIEDKLKAVKWDTAADEKRALDLVRHIFSLDGTHGLQP